MDKLQIKIAAKVNLGLDIVSKRDDNYHNIKTVMHSINIYDYLTFEKANKIEITCNHKEVPTDERNIVYKCIKAMSNYTDSNNLLRVHIEKRIPVCAGLGGGSSNGAAAILAYNELYKLNFSKEKLCKIGKEIGADIPFLIHSGAGICEGIGEIIRPIYPYIPCYMVLSKPNFGVSTSFAYDLIDNGTDIKRPDFSALMHGLLTSDEEDLKKGLVNVFEPFVISEYPEVGNIIDSFNNHNPIGVQMSGSGPSVFALFKNLEDAQKAYADLVKKYESTYLTNFLEEEDAIQIISLR